MELAERSLLLLLLVHVLGYIQPLAFGERCDPIPMFTDIVMECALQSPNYVIFWNLVDPETTIPRKESSIKCTPHICQTTNILHPDNTMVSADKRRSIFRIRNMTNKLEMYENRVCSCSPSANTVGQVMGHLMTYALPKKSRVILTEISNSAGAVLHVRIDYTAEQVYPNSATCEFRRIDQVSRRIDIMAKITATATETSDIWWRHYHISCSFVSSVRDLEANCSYIYEVTMTLQVGDCQELRDAKRIEYSGIENKGKIAKISLDRGPGDDVELDPEYRKGTGSGFGRGRRSYPGRHVDPDTEQYARDSRLDSGTKNLRLGFERDGRRKSPVSAGQTVGHRPVLDVDTSAPVVTILGYSFQGDLIGTKDEVQTGKLGSNITCRPADANADAAEKVSIECGWLSSGPGDRQLHIPADVDNVLSLAGSPCSCKEQNTSSTTTWKLYLILFPEKQTLEAYPDYEASMIHPIETHARVIYFASRVFPESGQCQFFYSSNGGKFNFVAELKIVESRIHEQEPLSYELKCEYLMPLREMKLGKNVFQVTLIITLPKARFSARHEEHTVSNELTFELPSDPPNIQLVFIKDTVDAKNVKYDIVGINITCSVFGGYPMVFRVNITCDGGLTSSTNTPFTVLLIDIDSLTPDMIHTKCNCTADHMIGDYDKVSSVTISRPPDAHHTKGFKGSTVYYYFLLILGLVIVCISIFYTVQWNILKGKRKRTFQDRLNNPSDGRPSSVHVPLNEPSSHGPSIHASSFEDHWDGIDTAEMEGSDEEYHRPPDFNSG